jgi:hypothetical protein
MVKLTTGFVEISVLMKDLLFFMSFDSNVSLEDRQKILHINTDDVAITPAIIEAGQLLDIQLLDHLVIGQGRFVSLKERGLGFG